MHTLPGSKSGFTVWRPWQNLQDGNDVSFDEEERTCFETALSVRYIHACLYVLRLYVRLKSREKEPSFLDILFV